MHQRYSWRHTSYESIWKTNTYVWLAVIIERTYCPMYAKNWSVMSEWNCRSRVIIPIIKGAPSKPSAGRLQINSPENDNWENYKIKYSRAWNNSYKKIITAKQLNEMKLKRSWIAHSSLSIHIVLSSPFFNISSNS